MDTLVLLSLDNPGNIVISPKCSPLSPRVPIALLHRSCMYPGRLCVQNFGHTASHLSFKGLCFQVHPQSLEFRKKIIAKICRKQLT